MHANQYITAVERRHQDGIMPREAVPRLLNIRGAQSGRIGADDQGRCAVGSRPRQRALHACAEIPVVLIAE